MPPKIIGWESKHPKSLSLEFPLVPGSRIPPGIPRVMNPSRAELLKILQIPLGMGSLMPGRRQNLGFSLTGIPGVPKSFPCFHGRAAGTGILSRFYPPAPPGKTGISSRESLSRRKTLAPHPRALQKCGISAQNNPSKGNPSLNPTENYPRPPFPENYPRPLFPNPVPEIPSAPEESWIFFPHPG